MTQAQKFFPYALAASTLVVGIAFCAAYFIHQFLPVTNLSLVFLLPVLFTGVRYGLWPSVYTVFLSFALYTFFFTEPRYTFSVNNYDDISMLLFYLLVAGVTGSMAIRLKKQIEALQAAIHHNNEMAQAVEESRIQIETEKLRAALLSSISHDLRTPLSSVIGSATTLLYMDAQLTTSNRTELTQNILQESERLNRFVQNLLDMTKLGYGNLEPKREWCGDIRDVLGRAAGRLQRELSNFRLEYIINDEVSNFYADPVLFEQMIFNILENSTKYAPEHSRIDIVLEKIKGSAVLKIIDQGPGIPVSDQPKVFDMFYRSKSGDSKVAGTGLGLAICRGLVKVHGGKIKATVGHKGKGTAIIMTFPLQMTQAKCVYCGEDEDSKEHVA